ncbi:sulfotransferase domain-containing protein [Methylomarinum vadi]|uniref:sulfotransferase domain-containing protein n=1 Tax=Methylomarinum vadi TaxID=438855 RepID=UPI0004DF2AEB|nr:sulfotransferase domain-containing protein [Methylomarinum vadi]
MYINWNLSEKKLAKLKALDVIILSVGKSGRTWLRVLLNKYLSLHYDVAFDLGQLDEYNPNIPRIAYSHEMWIHYSDASWLQRLKGKHIIPNNILRQKKVVLLYRDPRDVVVSLYFQKTLRSDNKISCSISDFIRHQQYGIDRIIKVLSIWEERLKDHPACLRLSYESMKTDVRTELYRLLEFIGINDINESYLDEAIEFSSFTNMKKMEQQDSFNNKILKPADPGNPDSFKVRKGMVGGYASYFDNEDLAYLNNAIRALPPSYGYAADTPYEKKPA